ncbi:MAG: hypothetical protein OEY85_09420 [Rhodospirillales bacterium]|nr:hypothetical protein [Rhodospirillales bacterium]
MPFVKRDADGNIIAVYALSAEDGLEEVAPGDSALRAFLAQQTETPEPDKEAILGLMETDVGMVRVLEDLINLLIDKGYIAVTELPEAAQQKLLDRGALRNRFGYLETLFSGDQEDEEDSDFAPDAKDFM